MKRNLIKRRALVALGMLVVAVCVAEPGGTWRELFDGETFDGWEIRGGGDLVPTFKVENGTVVGRTLVPRNNSAFLCTKEQFKDFELTFEAKIDEGLNSGVQIRSTPEGTVKGAQVEIEAGSKKTGYIFGQGMGMWLSEVPSDAQTTFKNGEWNTFRVVVRGQNIKTWLNGNPVADTTHEKIAAEGVVALQVHGYPRGKNRDQGAKEVLSVAWKNIKIKEIK